MTWAFLQKLQVITAQRNRKGCLLAVIGHIPAGEKLQDSRRGQYLFYDHNLKTHILSAFGEVPLRSQTRDGIQKWLHGKFSSGMSWNSVRHLRTTFGTLLNAAEMDELIRQNVVKKTRLPRPIHSENRR
jgi:hypothetical protein